MNEHNNMHVNTEYSNVFPIYIHNPIYYCFVDLLLFYVNL